MLNMQLEKPVGSAANMFIYSSVLNNHMKIIVQNVKASHIEYISLVLCGGYSRGEGSWIIERNGTYRPYNDYDILLVVGKKLPQQLIECLRKELANKIGIRWIDIKQQTPEELQKLCPTIFNYDLKYAGKVIDGNMNILDAIPGMYASTLPLREGEILFFTRLWTLLGCLDSKGFGVVREGEESRFFRNQMAKAILAVVDVILLQNKLYHQSYRERILRLTDIYLDNKDLCQLSQWALEEKLFPKCNKMSGEEVEELYGKVSSCFFKEMFRLLSCCYSRPVNCVEDIEGYLCYSPLKLIKDLGKVLLKYDFYRNWSLALHEFGHLQGGHLLGRNLLPRDPALAINLAQAYVAAAYENEEINRKLLRKGITWMRSIDKTISNALLWDEARIITAKMRNNDWIEK